MLHQPCEGIFEDWKNNRLQVSAHALEAFDLECCPEPYLLFGDQRAPITFFTANPGGEA